MVNILREQVLVYEIAQRNLRQRVWINDLGKKVRENPNLLFHTEDIYFSYVWPEVQLKPSQKLWSFREKKVPLAITFHEGGKRTGVKGKC